VSHPHAAGFDTTPEPQVSANAQDRSAPAGEGDASLAKVDITIAGHTVIVEAHRSMEDVSAQALDLIRRTAGYARRMPTGFDTGHPDTQISAGA
jgi:hypothetical protein